MVVCIEVLEHLFAPQEAVSEAFRVLRHGGLMVVTVPNVAYWRRRIDLALLGRWNPFGDDLGVEEPWRDPRIRFFNPGALSRLLAGIGFGRVEVGGHNGAFLSNLPWIGRHLRTPVASRPYRALMRWSPSLFGCRLHAVAQKP